MEKAETLWQRLKNKLDEPAMTPERIVEETDPVIAVVGTVALIVLAIICVACK